MPVGQFPASRNWGYDGVYPFAVQDSVWGSIRFTKAGEYLSRKRIISDP